MSEDSTHPEQPSTIRPRWKLVALLLMVAAVASGGSFYLVYRAQAKANAPQEKAPVAAAPANNLAEEDPKVIRAPELDGGVEWLNCGGPIRMKDLRGKIVLLDFWTYCCINCIHVMPDLAKLEKKYANQLVVIGVHSAKFDTEKDSKNIREAILRYDVEHPVVNDANHKIWNAYAVRSWPTFWLIDPEGNLYGRGSGEGLLEPLEEHIEKLIKTHREKKTLNEQPLRFDLAKFRERKDSPLYFPGKLLADPAGKRLFIADSSHHRIVITDLDGKKLDIVGTGEDGKEDGAFDKAKFNDPQGMALKGDLLYVADRKNHLLRVLDLKARTVKTIAGTGTQGMDRRASGDPLKIALNSPWDLLLIDGVLYIAMAGHHQIWQLDIKANELAPFAGNGREDLGDGTRSRSMFAQPSGLTTDGNWLYVADSEISAIRAVSLKDDAKVKTLVGEGLFVFGDIDGEGDKVRLQHPLAVIFHGGKLYVADTYNNKIKIMDPEKRSSETYLGDGKSGKDDRPARFDEPAGLSLGGDLLYVADTNNHAIRVIDLKKKEVKTLKLDGVLPPKAPEIARKPSFPNAENAKLTETTIPKDGEVTLKVKLELPKNAKLSPAAPVQYLVEGITAGGTSFEKTGSLEKCKTTFEIKVPAEKLAAAQSLKVSLVFFFCEEGGEGLCRIKSQIWEIPLRVEADAKDRTIQLVASAVSKEDKEKRD